MYKILLKEKISDDTILLKIHAPYAAQKAQPGQFVMLQAVENGERLPFSIFDFDSACGTITVICKIVGFSTAILDNLCEGEYMSAVAGPLGMPSTLEGLGSVCLISDNFHCSSLIPKAKKLKQYNCKTDVILSIEESEKIFFNKEFDSLSANIFFTNKENILSKFEELQKNEKYDAVFVCGSIELMRKICELTKNKTKTVVSLNTIMLDGTGICGGCRVYIDGKQKFACIDGPEFDGHKVNFAGIETRMNAHKEFETNSYKNHKCHIRQSENNVNLSER